MKKRCSKGKGCGASCIQRSDDCYGGLSGSIKDALAGLSGLLASVRKSKPDTSQQQISELTKALNLGPSERLRVGNNLKELRQLATERKKALWDEITKKRRIGGAKAKIQEQALQAEYDAIKRALQVGAPAKGAGPSVQTQGGRFQARAFDNKFIPLKKVFGLKDDYDWEESAKTAKFAGKGAFGVVLFGKDGNVVKRGEIGQNEIGILKKVGDLGLGPSLIYGETGGKKGSFAGQDIFFGRIAMTRAEGKKLGSFDSPDAKVGKSTVADLYWSARANLHRAGIAHNDSHAGNLMIGPKGSVKFIDFGMAQDNAKAALSEALGGIVHKALLPAGAGVTGTMKNDFQARDKKFSGNTGFSLVRNKMPEALGKMYDNFPKVTDYLVNNLGLSPSQAAVVMTTGIRNPDFKYQTGVWAKISDSDAKKMIDLLYDGV